MNELHSGHRKRMLKRLKENENNETINFSEHEMLEMILYTTDLRGDTNEKAHRLIEKFGSIYNICNASYDELISVKGVGKKTAEFLINLPLFAKAYETSCFDKSARLIETEKIAEYCKALFIGKGKCEILYVICLDFYHRIIKTIAVSEGTTGQLSVNMRKLVKAILECSADSVILTHNHPTQIAFPSQNDIAFTGNLIETLKMMNIELLDHIIVVDDKYFSFKGNQLLV